MLICYETIKIGYYEKNRFNPIRHTDAHYRNGGYRGHSAK